MSFAVDPSPVFTANPVATESAPLPSINSNKTAPSYVMKWLLSIIAVPCMGL
jgi:hypothetical protein